MASPVVPLGPDSMSHVILLNPSLGHSAAYTMTEVVEVTSPAITHILYFKKEYLHFFSLFYHRLLIANSMPTSF